MVATAQTAAEPGCFTRIRQVAPVRIQSTTRFLGLTRVCHQNASRSVQPFSRFTGLTVVTETQINDTFTLHVTSVATDLLAGSNVG